MVKIREFELDFIEEAPAKESRRDIRIKNHRTKEQVEHSRGIRRGRVWNGQSFNEE